MSHEFADERAELATLLPPSLDADPLPRRAARRAQLLDRLDGPSSRPRWTVPALAAGALAVTVAIAAFGVVVMQRDEPPAGTGWTTSTDASPKPKPKPTAEDAPASMADLLDRIDAVTATQKRVDLTGGQVVYRQLLPNVGRKLPTETWTTADAGTVLTRQATVTKPLDAYVSAEGTPVSLAIWYPSYRTLRGIENVEPQAILAQMAQDAAASGIDARTWTFTTLQKMLAVGVVPPAVRATLFHAMASIPGVTFERTSPAPFQGVPRMVLGENWTAVDVSTGAMSADQDYRYAFAGPAPALGADPVGRKARRPEFGPLQPVGAVSFDDVTLAVPDPYFPLEPSTPVAFRNRVGTIPERRYEVLDGWVTADVNGDGRSDVVTVIDVRGADGKGSPESDFLVMVYVRGSHGSIPFGVVRDVPPLSTGPTVSVADGVITVRPNHGGSSVGEPRSYRWNGVWFAPTS